MANNKPSYPYLLTVPKLTHSPILRPTPHPATTLRLHSRPLPQPQQLLTPKLLRQRRQFRLLVRILILIALFGLTILFLRIYSIYSVYYRNHAETTVDRESSPLDFQIPSRLPQLHLLIPITAPSLLFCKSLASTIFNSYPPPILINYNSTFSNPAFARGAKLHGVSSYLSNPNPLHTSLRPINTTSDLVLITDGFDIWFQLPPPVLLNRYLANFTTNSVVFGADKLCWPNAASSPACRLAPESTLPRDVYGVNTTDNDPAGYNVRPRFLNSGTVLGSWERVKQVYEKARKSGEGKSGGVWSDQGVLAEVWGGELENLQVKKEEETSNEASGNGEKTALGMVMDYQSDLFMTMTHAHADLQWNKVRIDIDSINSNFFLTNHLTAHPPPHLLLAQNIISNSTPALLHFNGIKSPLGTDKEAGWWGRMWWFHLDISMEGSISLSSEEKGRRAKEHFDTHVEIVRGGMGMENRYGGAWTDKGVWMGWGEVCGKWDFVGKGGLWGI